MAPPEAGSSHSNRAALVLAVVGAFAGGWFLNEALFLWTQNDPWSVGVLLGLAIAGGAAFFKWQEWRSERARRAEERRRRSDGEHGYVSSSDPRFRADRSWVAPVVILAGFGVYGFIDGKSARDHYVLPYCMYGARSQAQLDGCMSHVTSEEINDLETQAARFARGDTSDCLSDSGPFCEDAAKWNTIEPSDVR